MATRGIRGLCGIRIFRCRHTSVISDLPEISLRPEAYHQRFDDFLACQTPAGNFKYQESKCTNSFQTFSDKSSLSIDREYDGM